MKLIDEVLSKDNLNQAYLQVTRNKGASGVLTWFKIADALEMDIGTLMNLEKEYQIERLRLIKSRCPTEKNNNPV